MSKKNQIKGTTEVQISLWVRNDAFHQGYLMEFECLSVKFSWGMEADW